MKLQIVSFYFSDNKIVKLNLKNDSFYFFHSGIIKCEQMEVIAILRSAG